MGASRLAHLQFAGTWQLAPTADAWRWADPMRMQIRPFEPADEEAVVSLWQRCDAARVFRSAAQGVSSTLSTLHLPEAVGEAQRSA